MVSRELEKECIVVFDEAHNIDNVCIEVSALQAFGLHLADGLLHCQHASFLLEPGCWHQAQLPIWPLLGMLHAPDSNCGQQAYLVLSGVSATLVVCRSGQGE